MFTHLGISFLWVHRAPCFIFFFLLYFFLHTNFCFGRFFKFPCPNFSLGRPCRFSTQWASFFFFKCPNFCLDCPSRFSIKHASFTWFFWIINKGVSAMTYSLEILLIQIFITQMFMSYPLHIDLIWCGCTSKGCLRTPKGIKPNIVHVTILIDHKGLL